MAWEHKKRIKDMTSEQTLSTKKILPMTMLTAGSEIPIDSIIFDKGQTSLLLIPSKFLQGLNDIKHIRQLNRDEKPHTHTHMQD